MRNTSKTVRVIAMQGVIAAIYVVLAMLLQPISFGPVQFRVSEALTVLPFLSPYTAAGLTVGCLIANLLGGNGPLDVIFGTLATLIAAVLTSKIKNRWLAPLPPVLVNAVIVGAMLSYVLTPDAFWASFPVFAAEVGLGQIGACYVLGLPLLATAWRLRLFEGTKK